MENRTETLPTTEELEQQNAKLEQQVAELTAKVKWYEEQIRLANQKRFGASSEKTHQDQIEMPLFNEAEVLATPKGQETPTEQISYERRKKTGKRESQLDGLPIETITYELSEDEQVCTCCGGRLHVMSTETRNEIVVIPAEVKVVRHVRQVCACRKCEREEIRTPVITAPMPKPVYPGSLASPSSMAYVMTQKYVDSQPLYRQEQQFARMGLTISRQTMANWMIYGADQWLSLLTNRMKEHLLRQDICMPTRRRCRCYASREGLLKRSRTCGCTEPDAWGRRLSSTTTSRRAAASIRGTFWRDLPATCTSTVIRVTTRCKTLHLSAAGRMRGASTTRL
jgi:transposase